MDPYQAFKDYQSLQKEVISEIATSMQLTDLEDCDEDELWDNERELESGWVITPHGEHLLCVKDHKIRIQIPLYARGFEGIDPGHFREYYQTKYNENIAYNVVLNKLDILVVEGKATREEIEGMAVLWRIK